MTQTIEPGQGTRNLAPYISHPPTLRRPDAAETVVMFVVKPLPQTIATVEPFGPQAPPIPAPPMPAPEPEVIPGMAYPPPAPEALRREGRTLEYFGPVRKWGKTGTRRRPHGPAPVWLHAVWGCGVGMVIGALGVGVPLAALVVTR